jgi:hypothetical protein
MLNIFLALARPWRVPFNPSAAMHSLIFSQPAHY